MIVVKDKTRFIITLTKGQYDHLYNIMCSQDEIIDYLKSTYGSNNVSQMLTFGRLQGRSAIKEVLRINEACSFGEMNEISPIENI